MHACDTEEGLCRNSSDAGQGQKNYLIGEDYIEVMFRSVMAIYPEVGYYIK